MSEKPRIRVKAGTADSVQNFIARVGLGTSNQAAATSYGPSPISRNRLQLEYAYRGSWICRQIVDAPAEDMTRAGIDIETKDPKDGDVLQKAMQRLAIWSKMREAIQWSRLYGGGVAVIMIEGQDPASPLRPETVAKGAFKGLLPLDRWSVQPSFTDLVDELGPSYGQPKFYSIVATAMNIPRLKVHYSRVIRFEGEDLPIWQKMAENGWGLSVLEPVWDRLTSFDSTTVGVGQLVYKAHLRTLHVDGLREALASNGPELTGILKNVDMIRAMQTNEGLTLLDKLDEFQTHQYSFGGLSDVLVQFAQQLSGAAQIPLVRLFGQSPAGLNATGDADIRNYYDAIKSQQEGRMRTSMGTMLEVLHWSELGRAPDEGFSFSFRPLWQMSDKEKVEIAANVVNIVTSLEGAAIIDRATALKELRQASEVTGMFTSITDDDIARAENEPPPPDEDDNVAPPTAPDQDDLVDPEAGAEPGAGEEEEAAEAGAGARAAKDSAQPARDNAEFENEHPRAKNGEFEPKGGGGGGESGAGKGEQEMASSLKKKFEATREGWRRMMETSYAQMLTGVGYSGYQGAKEFKAMARSYGIKIDDAEIPKFVHERDKKHKAALKAEATAESNANAAAIAAAKASNDSIKGSPGASVQVDARKLPSFSVDATTDQALWNEIDGKRPQSSPLQFRLDNTQGWHDYLRKAPSARLAVDFYLGAGSGGINEYLRTGSLESIETALEKTYGGPGALGVGLLARQQAPRVAEGARRMFEEKAFVLENDVTLYRGVSRFDIISGLNADQMTPENLVGLVIQDAGMTSMASVREKVGKYADGATGSGDKGKASIEMSVKVGAGTPMVIGHPSETEVMMPPMTKIRITAVKIHELQDGTKLIVAEAETF